MTATTTTKSLNGSSRMGKDSGQKEEDPDETKANRAKASVKLHKLQPYTRLVGFDPPARSSKKQPDHQTTPVRELINKPSRRTKGDGDGVEEWRAGQVHGEKVKAAGVPA